MSVAVNITRWPCVIISNWRVGSTGLLFHIADQYSKITQAYSEPLIKVNGNFRNPSLRYFLLKSKNLEQILVKFHGWQLLTDPSAPYVKLLEADTFKIKISRRNIIDQITSYYISLKSKFTYDKGLTHSRPEISVNELEIYKCVDRIVRSNIIVDKLKVRYDLELFFEDVIPLENSVIHDARKFSPANRSEIRHAVELIYRDHQNTKDMTDLSWIPHNLNPHQPQEQQNILKKYYNI